MSFTLFHFDWLWTCSFFPALSDRLSCLQFSSPRLHMRLWFRFPWQPKTEAHMQTRRSEPSLGTSQVLQDWRLFKDMQLHSHKKCDNAMEVPTPKSSLSHYDRLRALGDWMGAPVYGRTVEATCTPVVNICGLVFYRSFFTDDLCRNSCSFVVWNRLSFERWWITWCLGWITQLTFWTWSA